MSEENFKSIIMDTGVIFRNPGNVTALSLFYIGIGVYEGTFGDGTLPYCITLSKDREEDMQYALGLMVEEKMVKVKYSTELDRNTVICRSERRKGER